MKIKVNLREVGIFSAGFVAGGAIFGVVFRTIYKKKYEKEVSSALDRVNEAEKLLRQGVNSENSVDSDGSGYISDDGGSGSGNRVEIRDSENDFGELTIQEYKKLREGVQVADSESATSGGNSGKRSSFRAYTDYYRGIKARDSVDDESVSVDPAENEHPEEDSDDDISEDEYAEITAETDEEYESYLMTKEIKQGYKDGPKIISMDAFEDERRDFDKVQLYYYTEDDILADENEDIIDDVERVVGDALDKYDFRNNDDMYVCVRNINYSTDYIIGKVLGSYYDLTK